MNANINVMFSLLCVFVLLSRLHLSNGAESEPLLLSPGSKVVGTDDDGRKWNPDFKYIDSAKPILETAGFQDPSLTSMVPYMDARIFTSESTYKFPITPNSRYWLRLHFYPSTYGSYDSANSYFTVMANELTLVKNFSAYLACQAYTQVYIMREFALAASEADVLTVTFKPDAGFAYINGIELIQMPEIFGSAAMVGLGDQVMDLKSSNMQTMFRLNVGGSYISPSNDSGGLSRSWYDDYPYVAFAAEGVVNEANPKLKLKYQDLPQYIAPAPVYTTQRSMGGDNRVNQNYNLTWILPNVDPGFMYLIRLHFCDFTLSRPNQVVFIVYINNQTAQPDADVIAWTGGKGIPTYKDYAIFTQNASDVQQIWLALHPAVNLHPEYVDAMLNGVEVFKIDSSGNLAGLNPKLSDFKIKVQAQSAKTFKSKDNNAQVIGGAAGGAAAFVVVALCFAVYQRKNRIPGADSNTTSWLPIYGNSHSSGSKSTVSGKSTASNLAQGLARHFSISEILQATKNFSDSNVIGVGGFGKVYKGVIDGGTKVAIKRSNPSSEQGVHEFLTEIDLLSKLRHKHLVSLIGFCDEENEMCLIYDYMGKGTMREHLYNKSNKPRLTWKQRLEICIGAARGLHYLHTGAQYTIIHRDVKTTNILLDDNWVAKVSDFGLSKTGPNMANGHVSTVVKGSFGYLDPEYFRRQQLTEKSDVYSFGVVLFEVLCARPALNPSLPKEQVSLADWALHCKRKGTLDDIIDPQIKGKINPDCLKKFTDAAVKCLDDHGVERPSMGDVLWNLEFALQLQESDDDSSNGSSKHREDEDDEDGHRNQDMAMHYNNLSLGSEHEFNEESKDQNSAPIFSQLVNPTGR